MIIIENHVLSSELVTYFDTVMLPHQAKEGAIYIGFTSFHPSVEFAARHRS
ncbi:hypothetical protein MTBBW1_290017 [Desulfamplus magnetovallimortis]|uniref:Uncharacterized protein n=1 Tax=Desulfamplus magnetovallimortis TaxID=1246637 RepID=A0A1W1HFM9_9BACT|nr:hypothetical protein MTBBW1_290017 [Desulfamplus magnetovallimortis]